MPEVVINGPEGRIEARYQKAASATAPVALVMHPHPRFGGTMNNKVVYNIFHALARSGFAVLRFNFRGVGKSQGTFDNGEGELADSAAALDWLQTYHPSASQTWVSGFSFGAWIAMQLLMRRPEITSFVSVAPPANVYDFAFLAPCPASGLIVHGDQDQVVPQESVKKLVDRLSNQRGIAIDYRIVKKADHFFSEQIETLTGHIDDYLVKAMGKRLAVAS